MSKEIYNQGNYQNRYISSSGDRRISFSGRSQYGQNYRGRPRYEQSYRSDLEEESLQVMWECIKIRILGERIIELGIRENYRNENYERGRSRSRERQYQGNIRRNGRTSSSTSRLGSKASTNRDRLRSYKCREYDHFAKDYLATKVEKETD